MAFVSPLTKVFTRTAAFPIRSISSTRTTPVAKMTLRADLDHIALDCKDNVKLHAFYRDVLQFDHMQIQGAPFPSVRVSDVTILDFMQSGKPRGLDGANHMCFSVAKDDMDALKNRLAEKGITVEEPRKLGGAKGYGWSVFISDPEENKLELRYYD